MEELYKSLISGSDTLIGQLENHFFGMTESDGPVLIFVNSQRKFSANHPGKTSFLHEKPDILKDICGRIDDGDDPCVYRVEAGCLVGTQLATEYADYGYLLVFMSGYQKDTMQANMDLFELILAQTQLICHLLEKNNRLHHTHLSGMRDSSPLLCS